MNVNNIKPFKTVLNEEKWNNVFLSQTAEMAAIEFNLNIFHEFWSIHDNGILSLRAQKLSFYTIFQQTKKPKDKIKLDVCRNIYSRKIRQAKKVYFSKLIGCQKRNAKKMWDTLKNITGMGNKPNQSSMKLIPLRRKTYLSQIKLLLLISSINISRLMANLKQKLFIK